MDVSNADNKAVSVLDYLRLASDYFSQKGISTPRLDAEILLGQALNLDRLGLYLKSDRPLSSEEISVYRGLIKRRIKREPIAYITGKKEFYGFDFFVDRSVLIPRPETESLVEWVVNWAENSTISWKKINIADIGTGSGCIAISLMLELGIPNAFVMTDISNTALDIVKKNIELHGLEKSKNIFIQNCSFFDGLSKDSFDIIVANPPYISLQEKADLEPEITEYEPFEALFADNDGLGNLIQLIQKGYFYLKKNGFMILEIGFKQKEPLKILAQKYSWNEVSFFTDLAGLDRIILLKKSG